MQLVYGKLKSIKSENIMEENYNRLFSFQRSHATDVNVVANFSRKGFLKDKNLTRSKKQLIPHCDLLGSGLDFLYDNEKMFQINDLINIRILLFRWINTRSFNNKRSVKQDRVNLEPIKVTCVTCGHMHHTKSTIAGLLLRFKAF